MGTVVGAQQQATKIRLGVLGKGSAGKTCLILAICRAMVEMNLGDELELAPPSVEKMKDILDRLGKDEQQLTRSVLHRTAAPVDISLSVFNGHQRLIDFIYTDAVGQIVSSIKLGTHEDGEHKTFVNELAEADVIWVVLPINREGTRCKINVQDAEYFLKSYLREALELRQLRNESKTISVAIVLTKADLAGNSPESAADELNRLMEEARQRFSNLLNNSAIVYAASVFPVSAFGFESARPEELNASVDRIKIRESLLINDSLQPWNIENVLLWSIVCGLQQPGIPIPRNQRERDVAVSQKLDAAWALCRGPSHPIKKVR